MDTHEAFHHSLTAAPQDVSLPVFEALLNEGYDKATWHSSPSATDGVCIAKDGDTWGLAEFLKGPTGAGLQHAAAIYERSHVACKCMVTVSGPGKPDVSVTAFGRQ